jgi:radical SAM protein with 4Fe4S-binding SPASM domain
MISSSPINPKRINLVEVLPLSTPFFVFIDICSYCNLSCYFCANRLHLRKPSFMSIELIKKIVADLRNFKQTIKVCRICGFGEPLMNPDIIPIFDVLTTKSPFEKFELVTNGTKIDEKIAKRIGYYFDKITISLYGLNSEDYQDKVNFGHFLDMIQCLFKNRMNCKIHIKVFNQIINTAEKEAIFHSLFNDICDKFFIESISPQWPVLDNIPHQNKSKYQGQLTKHDLCPQIFKGLQIASNGEVIACCHDWEGKNIVGDVKTSSFINIWNGDRLRNLQIEHLLGNKNNLDPCKNCFANDYVEVDSLNGHQKDILKRLQSVQIL